MTTKNERTPESERTFFDKQPDIQAVRALFSQYTNNSKLLSRTRHASPDYDMNLDNILLGLANVHFGTGDEGIKKTAKLIPLLNGSNESLVFKKESLSWVSNGVRKTAEINTTECVAANVAVLLGEIAVDYPKAFDDAIEQITAKFKKEGISGVYELAFDLAMQASHKRLEESGLLRET